MHSKHRKYRAVSICFSLFCSLNKVIPVYYDCPSRDCNKDEAINRSVSLAVSISPGGRSPFHVKTSSAAPVILSFAGCACVGCVQVPVTHRTEII